MNKIFITFFVKVSALKQQKGKGVKKVSFKIVKNENCLSLNVMIHIAEARLRNF